MATKASKIESAEVVEGSTRIHVDVMRMRSRKRTCSVYVKDDGKVIVKCPVTMTWDNINRFLDNKHDWIVSHYLETQSRKDEYRDILDLKAIMVNGKTVPLVFGPNPGIYMNRIEIRTKDDISKLFINEFGYKLIDFAMGLALRLGACPTSINVKGYKSRWGCCNSDGDIYLNYVLAMLPREEQELVIIHELCHLLYMNHSADFHAQLDKWYPDNRRVQKKLNSYSFLLRFYNSM
ncbi:MAG: M48 family metallopeptidase [Clostridia bacterium]|nr:M48 family metallopeptidase [Clostridia bacterium]